MSLTPDNPNPSSYVGAAQPALQSTIVAFKPVAAQPVVNESLALGIIGGIAGAIAGAALYVAFIQATHIRIGYLSIAVAYLVAKGIMMGSRAKGGLQYQVTAVLMTCAAVSVGNAVNLYLDISRSRGIELTLHSVLVLLQYGAADPILRFETAGPRAIIGLIILFVGLRAAWRMTSGDPEAMSHPFRR